MLLKRNLVQEKETLVYDFTKNRIKAVVNKERDDSDDETVGTKRRKNARPSESDRDGLGLLIQQYQPFKHRKTAGKP
jgi:hypothetical protein